MKTLRKLLVLAAFCLTGHSLRAQTPDILVSGFEAFGGRSENASWVLAQELAKAFPQDVRSLKVPVLWGAPLESINGVSPQPKVWIAFGEGTPEFQIEIVAHNLRGRYPDNHGMKPMTPDIVKDAEPELRQQARLDGLAEALTQAGFPTHVSENAGRYLCEEMLYSLLHVQKQHPEALKLVVFIHVPPLGQTVKLPASTHKVDAAWLQAFGKQLFASMRKLDLLPAAAH